VSFEGVHDKNCGTRHGGSLQRTGVGVGDGDGDGDMVGTTETAVDFWEGIFINRK
jgi:hypothetical protein